MQVAASVIMLARPATDDPTLRPRSWSWRSKDSAIRVATIAPRMAGTEQLVRRREEATFTSGSMKRLYSRS
jgi:hypothetical protein